MRDPKRIDEVLEKIKEYWELNPDFRLGQALCYMSFLSHGDADPFYLEDDKLLIVLNDLIASRKGAESHDDSNSNNFNTER